MATVRETNEEAILNYISRTRETNQYYMWHAKENPFRRYMDFLNELHELSDEEQAVYDSIGREFLSLIKTTDMQKVYKMPIIGK